jgi:acyl carrier protein
LDSIEIAMQLEEDLGYVISAETLSQFQRIKHYINYIEQVEGFKRDNNGKAPLP